MIGNPVSFMQPELGEAIAMMDENLQAALRRSLSGETQPFTITAKITFTPVSGAFYPQYEVGHQFDPIKVKSKASARDYLHIAQDKFGVPVFSEDGESQMSFDEIDAGATVTADASGVVQSVELDDADFERVFPCDCSDCPLHTVYTGGEEGCSFCGDTDAPLDSDLTRTRYTHTAPEDFRFGAGTPLYLIVNAYMGIPKSKPKYQIMDMIANILRPTKKPDWDNIGKIISDALNKSAYADDAQIVDAHIIKWYSHNPRVEVEIGEIKDLQHPAADL